MNLVWTTSLRVFPQHCNHHQGMIFGGEMLAQMDLAAAAAVARLLYDSPKGVTEGLTVGVDKVTFHKGAKVGDLIIFTATITDVGQKRISVNVVAEKESPRADEHYDDITGKYKWIVERSKMAEGIFHFCAYDMEAGKGTEHGMVLPTCTLYVEQFEPESSTDNSVGIYDNRMIAEDIASKLNEQRETCCEDWHVEDFKQEDAHLPFNPSLAHFTGRKEWYEAPRPMSLLEKEEKPVEPKVLSPAVAEIPDEYPVVPTK